jgi:hypothetical protein
MSATLEKLRVYVARERSDPDHTTSFLDRDRTPPGLSALFRFFAALVVLVGGVGVLLVAAADGDGATKAVIDGGIVLATMFGVAICIFCARVLDALDELLSRR